MKSITTPMILFACFAVGLPSWMMLTNEYSIDRIHGCTGECYQAWREETGGVVAIAAAAAAQAADAGPVELGKKAYIGCIACHGAAGQGGVGPRLSAQSADAIAEMLRQYKRGETRGAQSNLMWGQAAALSDDNIVNLSRYIETL